MNDAFLMNHEDNNDLEELSPLMEAIVPKLAACHIREYQPEDLEACIEVYRSNEPDFLAPEGLENFIEFLKLGTSYYLVIEHDGDVIGCGGLELVGHQLEMAGGGLFAERDNFLDVGHDRAVFTGDHRWLDHMHEDEAGIERAGELRG